MRRYRAIPRDFNANDGVLETLIEQCRAQGATVTYNPKNGSIKILGTVEPEIRKAIAYRIRGDYYYESSDWDNNVGRTRASRSEGDGLPGLSKA